MAKFFGKTSVEELDNQFDGTTDPNLKGEVPVEEAITELITQEEIDNEATTIIDTVDQINTADEVKTELENKAEENIEKLEDPTSDVTASDVVESNEALKVAMAILGTPNGEPIKNIKLPSVESAGSAREALRLSTEDIAEFIRATGIRIKELFRKVLDAIRKFIPKALLYISAYINNAKRLKEKADKVKDVNGLKFDTETANKILLKIGLYAIINNDSRIDGNICKKLGIIGYDRNTIEESIANTTKYFADKFLSIPQTFIGIKESEQADKKEEEIIKTLKQEFESKLKEHKNNFDKLKSYLEDYDKDIEKSLIVIVKLDGRFVKLIQLSDGDEFSLNFKPKVLTYNVDAVKLNSMTVIPATKKEIIEGCNKFIEIDKKIKEVITAYDKLFKYFENALDKITKINIKTSEQTGAMEKALSFAFTGIRIFGTTYVIENMYNLVTSRRNNMYYMTESYKLLAEKEEEKQKK